MPYLGKEPVRGQNRELDDISGSFNGGNTAFTMQVGGINTAAGSANQVFISVGGVMQNPGTDFTVSSSTITFTTPPANGLDFWGLIQGDAVDINTPADGSVTSSKIASANLTLPSDLTIPDKIVHDGDTNTAIRFPAADTVSVETGGSERVRVDSSGNVGIGTTSPNAFSNYTTVTINGGTAGAGVDLELSDDNIYGRLFADTNGLQIQSTQAGDSIRFETAGANVRARITDDGLCFNADTAAANALDDYEEGTWDVVVTGAESGATSTYSGAGVYTKIGRVVHCNVKLNDVTFPALGGLLQLSAPFAANASAHNARGGPTYWEPTSVWDDYTDFVGMGAVLSQGSSYFHLDVFRKDEIPTSQSAGSGGRNGNLSTASGVYLQFSITYMV